MFFGIVKVPNSSAFMALYSVYVGLTIVIIIINELLRNSSPFNHRMPPSFMYAVWGRVWGWNFEFGGNDAMWLNK